MILLYKNTSSFYKNVTKLFLLVLFYLPHKSYTQQWELNKDRNGVKVYTRQSDAAKLKEYKAVVLAKSSVEKALKIITDGDNLWKWNHKTAESKTIKTISDSEFVFWMKNNLPWPVKNRDLVSRIKVSHQEDGTVIISIAPETTYSVPVDSNSIRLKNFKGHWLLVPKGEYVEITQQLYGDPEGFLPAWIVNTFITNAPYYTFLNLKEILEN